MKVIKKRGKKCLNKFLHLIAVVAMLIQPAGTPALIAAIAPVNVAEIQQEAGKAVADVIEEKAAPKIEAPAPTETPAAPVPKEETLTETITPAVPVPTEETPVENIEPVLPPATDAIIPPAEEAPTPVVETPTEPIKEIWSTKDAKSTTNDPVEIGKEYQYPGNKEVVVKFTKLPEKPGTLSIEEIKLSDKEVASLGAFSNVAYDITSTMADGTFAYDLTLPKPKDENNVEVKYAEDVDKLEDAKAISGDDVDVKVDSVKISDLDHFTVFVVTMEAGPVATDSLVINEIDYDQYGTDTAEFIEIKNTTSGIINIADYELRLINGSGGGAALYDTVDLPNFNLNSGDYYVVCSSTTAYPTCDMVESGFLIQNGDPDAVALYDPTSVLVDTVSYGGNVPGYTEGTGAVKDDASSINAKGLSRYSDGQDTNNNSADFVLSCITPGASNVNYPDCANPPQTDTDSDGAPDATDNCPAVVNPSQEDQDGDGVGDYCDLCQSISNPDQVDADGDFYGNVCDNCPNVYNQTQADSDGDGIGDSCDTIVEICGNGEDDEGDGFADCSDSDCANEPACQGPICGNSVIEVNEQCDDGNTNNNDGCSSTCQTELCNPGCMSPTWIGDQYCDESCNVEACNWDGGDCGAVCGNGQTESGEECDDGNIINDDGCESDCTLPPPVEICDDGLDNDCDGLTDCADFECANDPICQGPVCGDGIVTSPREECDIFSQPQECTTGGYQGEITCGPSCLWNTYCYPKESCGDGIINGPEECDDGNSTEGDGCNNSCQIEILPVCGDGTVNQASEQCDDGNLVNGDGCSAACQTEKDGSISGQKFEDCNADGILGDCEYGMKGWTIFIDENNNSQLDPGESTTSTGKKGDYIFKDLPAGTYRVCESPKAGWIQTLPGGGECYDIVLNSEDLTGYNFGNFKLATVKGRKYNDLNGNGGWNWSEPFLNDWTIRLYDSNWQKVGEKNTAGGFLEKGTYSFNNLQFGTYYVCEAMTAGWQQTAPKNNLWGAIVDNQSGAGNEGAKCYKINVDCSGEIFSGKTFGNHEQLPLCGDGIKNGSEECDGLDGLTEHQLCTPLCKIKNLPYCGDGIINDCEQCDDGNNIPGDGCSPTCETETFPYCGDGIINGQEQCDDGNILNGDGCSAICETEKPLKGNLTICKYNDLNKDGLITEGEPLLWWSMTVVDKDGPDAGETWYTATPAENCLTLNDMDLGEYEITEAAASGWTRSYPADSDSQIIILDANNPNATVNFLNYETPETIEPRSLLTKSNNKFPVDQLPGAEVVYTLLYKILDSNISQNHVIDLPPEGFKYRAGSWKVFLNGAEQFGVPEPQYHSPADWNLESLGTLKSEDEVKLVYLADISNVQDPGLYNDLAWAEGISDSNNQILANIDEAPTPFFVGTAVSVIREESAAAKVALNENVDHRTKTKTKKVARVLGASTELPGTGTNNSWIIAAALALLSGLALLWLGRKKKNISVGIILFSALGASLLFGSQKVFAAIELAAEIEQPKTPINTNSFKIGFVTLDILGRNVSAECWKKGPTEANFSQFTANYTVKPGGNSGDCQVSPAVAPQDGIYEFKVITTAGGDEAETETVSVEIRAGRPGTPLNYDRDGDSCNLTFTTANDGLTSKAELYRSKDLEFTADASTFAAQVVIGPNTNGSLSDPLGNCDDYFYAIRAVDDSGNGSGFVGDEKTKVKTNTKTKTKYIDTFVSQTGAIPTEGGAISGEGVEGETTEIVDEGLPEENGLVLGEKTEEELAREEAERTNNQFWKTIGIIAGLGALGYVIYSFIKKRRSKDSNPDEK